MTTTQDLKALKAVVLRGMSATDFLRRFRRLMRAKGLKVEDLPQEIGPSYLFVHQQALMEYNAARKQETI
jgi:hypothetical protein